MSPMVLTAGPQFTVKNAATLYRLAIEKAPAGNVLHGAGESGITSRPSHIGSTDLVIVRYRSFATFERLWKVNSTRGEQKHLIEQRLLTAIDRLHSVMISTLAEVLNQVLGDRADDVEDQQ